MIQNYLCVVVNRRTNETLASYEIQENTEFKHPDFIDKFSLARSARWRALLKFEEENKELLPSLQHQYAVDSVEV